MPRLPRAPLAGAAACGGLLLVTGLLAFGSASVRARDAASLDGFMALGATRLGEVSGAWAHVVDPPLYALAALALVGAALRVHGRRHALAVALVLIGSAVTTRLLKLTLAAPRPNDVIAWQVDAASWPSGHATAALALAIALVLAVPRPARPFAVLAGVPFAVSVSYATLVQGWHLPTDTVGGLLVAALWGCLALAVVAEPGRDRGTRPATVTLFAAAAGLAAAAGALLALDAALGGAAALPQERTSYLVVSGLIAAIAMAAAATLGRLHR